jgi:hypothetical protein
MIQSHCTIKSKEQQLPVVQRRRTGEFHRCGWMRCIPAVFLSERSSIPFFYVGVVSVSATDNAWLTDPMILDT